MNRIVKFADVALRELKNLEDEPEPGDLKETLIDHVAKVLP